MHLYNKEQAIKRMNQFGQHHRPFVFIINYLQDASYIEEVAAVDSTELLYNLNGFTNQATSTEKYTPSFLLNQRTLSIGSLLQNLSIPINARLILSDRISWLEIVFSQI